MILLLLIGLPILTVSFLMSLFKIEDKWEIH